MGKRVRLYPLDDDLGRRQLPLGRHPLKKIWINIQVLVGVPEHNDACSGCSDSHPNIDYVAQLRRRAVVIEHPQPFTRDSWSPRRGRGLARAVLDYTAAVSTSATSVNTTRLHDGEDRDSLNESWKRRPELNRAWRFCSRFRDAHTCR